MRKRRQPLLITIWQWAMSIICITVVNYMYIKSAAPYYSLVPLFIIDAFALIAFALPFIARLSPKNPILYAFILALRKTISGKRRLKQ